MGISSVEELVEGSGIVEVAVVDEVLPRVLGVVRPRLRREPPDQLQHLLVRPQSPLHLSFDSALRLEFWFQVWTGCL